VGEAPRLIRPLRSEDAGALGAVHVRAWQTAYRDLLPAQYLANLTIAERTAQWAEALARAPRPRGARFGAEVGGHVVGFILVGAASGDPASPTGEVYTINVDPDHWGSGVGRARWGAVD
jgi:ribosomal protein S18 acetylase RimI-like enzyme